MQSWVLVIALNRSPAELKWFGTKLAALAGDVDPEWRGIDWLDNEAAGNEAFQTYVEGPDSRLMKTVAQYQLEQAALADGASNLFTRNQALRERVCHQHALDVALGRRRSSSDALYPT